MVSHVRYAAAALAVTLLAAMLGCAGPTPDIVETPPRPGPAKSFDAQLGVAGSALRIRYTFRNDSPAPIVVFNGLPTRDGPGIAAPDPDAVYIREDAAGVAFITKQLGAPPADWTGPAHYLRGTVLATDDTLEEEITVPLPLTERGPYRSPQPLTDPVHEAQFCLGFAPVSEVTSSPGGDAKHPAYAQTNRTGAPYSVCSSTTSLTGGD